MEGIVIAMGWQNGQKNVVVEDLKQIWNRANVVAITVAIMEH